MILKFSINNDIESKKELLDFLYPNLVSNQVKILTNENSRINRFCKKNIHTLELIKRLELVEV